jgi:HTH-type transcriptional regulator/antitoxin HigA
MTDETKKDSAMHWDEIKNDEELETAGARLDQIWSAKRGDPDWEERSKLVELISAYEDEHVHIPPPDPIEAIKFRMEHGGLCNKDIVPYIGSPSKVSEVLSGKRSLSKEMIRKLHQGLEIPLKSLLGIADDIPEGFVRVEWTLPSDVVHAVTVAAQSFQLTEEQWVAEHLMPFAGAVSTSKTLTDTNNVYPIRSTTAANRNATDCREVA